LRKFSSDADLISGARCGAAAGKRATRFDRVIAEAISCDAAILGVPADGYREGK